MEKEKRLIYLDEAKKQFDDIPPFIGMTGKCVQEMLEKAPTVDAVEVVRCKNCRFSSQHDIYDPMVCMKWKTKWGVVYTTPDGYCHKGERRTNE